eukprot:3901200-Heterocapsa_arctica.AAC.1
MPRPMWPTEAGNVSKGQSSARSGQFWAKERSRKFRKTPPRPMWPPGAGNVSKDYVRRRARLWLR